MVQWDLRKGLMWYSKFQIEVRSIGFHMGAQWVMQNKVVQKLIFKAQKVLKIFKGIAQIFLSGLAILILLKKRLIDFLLQKPHFL